MDAVPAAVVHPMRNHPSTSPNIPNVGPTHVEATLRRILDAFSAGREVPGSGSANGLSACIAAALTASVAHKTVNSTLPSYRPAEKVASDARRHSLLRMEELVELIDRDAHAFAPVIAIRREARKLSDTYLIDKAKRREIEALKPATEIPINVAQLSLEIGRYSVSMLRQGFSAARGESYTALALAISAVDGSLYVARINLQKIQKLIEALHDPGYELPWVRSQKKRIESVRREGRALRTEEAKARRNSEKSLKPLRRRRTSKPQRPHF